jgi:ABC-2 type transport system ATP-binding protein
MSEVLRTHDLTKRYRGKTALEKLNITLEEGHIYGLIGLNGAGKTTLMRLLAGLSEPTEGSFSLFGSRTPAELCRARRRVGFLIEKPIAYENLSLRRNLILHASLLGRVNRKELDALQKQLDITDAKVGRRYGSCSMGEKQRYGIAAALLGDPALLVLDEPVNGLDPAGVKELRELLLRRNREKGTTMLISSHILEELQLLATDYLFLHEGKLLLSLTAEELDSRLERENVLRLEDFFLGLTEAEKHGGGPAL